MTASAYTTDLVVINEAETTTGWAELSGHTSGGAATQDEGAFLQNTFCISQSTGQATGTAAGLEYDYGSAIAWCGNR
jgi:hypothetical protein